MLSIKKGTSRSQTIRKIIEEYFIYVEREGVKMKFETIKTIAYDITRSVFDNDTKAIMYVTWDFYSDSYIVAIPVISFSSSIPQERRKLYDLDWLRQYVPIIRKERKEKLIEAIKEAIAEF